MLDVIKRRLTPEPDRGHVDMSSCGGGKVPGAQGQPTQHSWHLSNNEKYGQARNQRNVKTYNNHDLDMWC